MTPKQIEKVMAAAHRAVEAHRTLPELSEDLAKLGAVLREVDPANVYKRGTLGDEIAAAGLGEPREASLRDCPRLPRLIGENEAGTHD
jgi:hypothetical protein